MIFNHGIDRALHQNPSDRSDDQLKNQIQHGAVLCRLASVRLRLVQQSAHLICPVKSVYVAGNDRQQKRHSPGCFLLRIGKRVDIVGDMYELIESIDAEGDDAEDDAECNVSFFHFVFLQLFLLWVYNIMF